MNFEKAFISESIGTLLRENLHPEDVETLNRVLQGKKAKVSEANSLLTSVLRALVNQNEREESEFEVSNLETAGDNFSQELTQQGRQQNQIEPNHSASTQPEEDRQLDQIESNSNIQTQTDEEEPSPRKGDRKTDEKNVCKFYRNGRCKYGKECRKPHPAFCPTYIKNGPKSQNPRGCDGKCTKLHPNACRQSLRTKECKREDCRFYHLKGTLRGKTNDRGSNNSNYDNRPKQAPKGSPATTPWEQPNSQKESAGNQDQGSVFQSAQITMMNAITMLAQQMEEIRKLVTTTAVNQPQLRQQQSQFPWTHPQQNMSQ